MFYYNFHINDFNSETRHLSLMERAVYFELQNYYYASEKPINRNELELIFRKICINENDHKRIAMSILKEFFILKDGFYHSERMDNDIDKYKKNLDHKSAAGKRSAESRSKQKIKLNGEINKCSTIVNNQEPQTINQEPLINNQELTTHEHKPTCNNQNALIALCSSDELIKLWDPHIDEINQYLCKSSVSEISVEEFKRIQPRFLSHYYADIQAKKINSTQLMGKFVFWKLNQEKWEQDKINKLKKEKSSNWSTNKNLEKLQEVC